MITPHDTKFTRFVELRARALAERGLGGCDIELIDTWDYRDVWATARPDPDEEPEFAPMRDERRYR